MITDGRVLAGMVRHGFILWQDEVERHWTGASVRRRHVEPGPKLEVWWQEFTYRGNRYRLHYVDGCFRPFVFKVGSDAPSFV